MNLGLQPEWVQVYGSGDLAQRPWLMHRELGVRAAHSDILHLRVVRFSVLVSSLDEECVAQEPSLGW